MLVSSPDCGRALVGNVCASMMLPKWIEEGNRRHFLLSWSTFIVLWGFFPSGNKVAGILKCDSDIFLKPKMLVVFWKKPEMKESYS